MDAYVHPDYLKCNECKLYKLIQFFIKYFLMHKNLKIKHIKEVVFIIYRLITRIYINFNIMIIVYCIVKNQYLLFFTIIACAFCI